MPALLRSLLSRSSLPQRLTTTTTAAAARARCYTSHAALPEEHRMIYDMCRKFADEELAPHAGTWDQKHEFPKAAVQAMVR